jgi:hypothetical protein
MQLQQMGLIVSFGNRFPRNGLCIAAPDPLSIPNKTFPTEA